ncbi:MAG TPA: AEC family transporter [Patescibacteria group bacterium]|nr:AEC family transporter [Patescibacteria group bacterium]
MDNLFVIKQVAVLAVLALVGFVARKKKVMNDESSKGLSSILLYIALPAMIISAYNFKFSMGMLQKGGLAVIFSIIIHALLIVINKVAFRRYGFDKRNVLSFVHVFANAGFIGLPLVLQLYNQEGVFYASMFMIPFHILMWTYGQGLFMKDKKGLSFIAQVANPNIISVMIGLVIFIFSIEVPYVIMRPLNMLSGLTAPLAMMIVGDKIAQMKWKDLFSDKDIYIACLARLVVAPVITYAIMKGANLDPVLIGVGVTLESIPAAVAVVVLAEKYGGDVMFASKCTLISHIISVITMTAILLFLR